MQTHSNRYHKFSMEKHSKSDRFEFIMPKIPNRESVPNVWIRFISHFYFLFCYRVKF